MILTCPNCSTRYLMSAASIGPAGREVRCAKCAHQWFVEGQVDELDDQVLEEPVFDEQEDQQDSLADQEEEINVEDRLKDIASQIMDDEGEDENFEDQADQDDYERAEQELEEQRVEGEDASDQSEELPAEDIPNSVKPDHAQANVPAFAADVMRPEMTLQAKLMGYGAALVVFSILFVGLLVFQKKIIETWPPAIAIYELAGFTIPFKGEELILENLDAEVITQNNGADILVLKGRILNLTDRTVDVPRMLAILRNTNGEADGQWIIDPPVDQVEAGASFTFTSEYAGIPGGIGSVNLTFTPELIGG